MGSGFCRIADRRSRLQGSTQRADGPRRRRPDRRAVGHLGGPRGSRGSRCRPCRAWNPRSLPSARQASPGATGSARATRSSRSSVRANRAAGRWFRATPGGNIHTADGAAAYAGRGGYPAGRHRCAGPCRRSPSCSSRHGAAGWSQTASLALFAACVPLVLEGGRGGVDRRARGRCARARRSTSAVGSRWRWPRASASGRVPRLPRRLGDRAGSMERQSRPSSRASGARSRSGAPSRCSRTVRSSRSCAARRSA